MRCFVIADASKRKARPVGALFWEQDGNNGCFSLELSSLCNESMVPLSLSFCLNRPARCATPAESAQWVRSRIVPEDRHNIREVLAAHGLDAYDDLALLSASLGRSSDDDFLVFEVQLPEDLAQALVQDKPAKKGRRARTSKIEPPASRADALLDAVGRRQEGGRVEYAVVALPDGGSAQGNRSASRGTRNAAQRIGAHIREERLEAGLTQAQLAARAGISQVVLSRIETGAGNPTLALLEEIASALGTTLQVALSREQHGHDAERCGQRDNS